MYSVADVSKTIITCNCIILLEMQTDQTSYSFKNYLILITNKSVECLSVKGKPANPVKTVRAVPMCVCVMITVTKITTRF